jgi:hypothetical protein
VEITNVTKPDLRNAEWWTPSTFIKGGLGFLFFLVRRSIPTIRPHLLKANKVFLPCRLTDSFPNPSALIKRGPETVDNNAETQNQVTRPLLPNTNWDFTRNPLILKAEPIPLSTILHPSLFSVCTLPLCRCRYFFTPVRILW